MRLTLDVPELGEPLTHGKALTNLVLTSYLRI